MTGNYYGPQIIIGVFEIVNKIRRTYLIYIDKTVN